MDEIQQRIQAQSSLGSDTTSEQSENIEPQNAARTICLVAAAADNPDTLTAAKSFVNATVVMSETGVEYSSDSSTVFVLSSFEGAVFDALYKAKRILLGPPALRQLSHISHPLPINTRPLYSLAMSGVVVCVTGFRDKETLGELVTIVHQLGGSIRKDLSQKVTHLIANYTGGAKYEYADTFRLPVMQRSWVLKAWERRDEIGFVATEETFLAECKLKPFYGARVCFLGFAKEEERDMINVLQENGGVMTTIEDPSCTHVVMDPDYVVVSSTNSNKAPVTTDLEAPSMLTSSPEPQASTICQMNVDSTPLHNSTILLPTVTEQLTEQSGTKDVDFDVLNETKEVQSTRKRKFLSPSDRRFSIFDSKRNKKDVNVTVANSESRVTRRMSKMFLTPLDYFGSRRRTIGMTMNDTLNVSIASTSTLFETSTLTNLNESNRTTNRPRANLFTRSANKILNRNNKSNKKSSVNLNCTNISLNKTNTSIYPTAGSEATTNKRTATKLNINPFQIPAIVLSPALPLDVEMAPACNVVDKMDSKMALLTTHKDAVVDDGGASTTSVTDKTDSILRAHLVKAEWFWTSVQKETCLPVKNYMFDGHIDGIISPPPTPSHPSTSTPSSSTPTHLHTPSSTSRRKRKRLHETLSSLAQATTPHHLKPTTISSPRLVNNRQQSLNIEGIQPGASSSSIGKQRRSSSASDGLGLSVTGGSFVLDCTASPGLDLVGPVGLGVKEAVSTVTAKESKRQQVFQELVHTESNYVNILHTIVTTFKKHLEDASPPDQLLNPTELKIIFGRVPLIYATHLHMLNALRTALASYSDSVTSVGDIILRYSTDLLHAYPPFINAYEDMKSMLEKCDREKPRFHAFLKACQTRPECGRQGLGELMIRPVQRLGSISLLLNDILKHTVKVHPDHALLVQALASIKEVLSQINEDKRKAEGQRVMFDIFNEIDNCPPDVVSSHRSFVARCDVLQLSSSDNTVTTSKGTPLCLFLFSDQLGICKRRNNHRSNSNPFPTNHQPPIMMKSPTGSSSSSSNNNHPHQLDAQSQEKHSTLALNGTIGGHHKVGSGGGSMNGVVGVKAYKHVKLMSLSVIRRVIDIKDTEDCQRVCSLIFMNNGELKEKLFSFAITDDEVDKTSFLKTLCHQMATNACTADSEKFMAYCEAHQLDIDTSYLHGTLSKAVKFAYRTRLKVGRAFSFNKTPAKLKRAVSSMMSPFGSSNNLTPASQLAQMRLASYSNINELGHTTNTESAPIAPLSVQPTRKIKPSSLGASVLKRL